MARKTYTIEHQRLQPGKGYQPCEPHQASRIVLLEITLIPATKGRHPQRITRKLQEFYGAGAAKRAAEQLAICTRGASPRPKERRIWGRSLTQLEYNEAVASGATQPAVHWSRFPIRDKAGFGRGRGRPE